MGSHGAISSCPGISNVLVVAVRARGKGRRLPYYLLPLSSCSICTGLPSTTAIFSVVLPDIGCLLDCSPDTPVC